jgi:UDP-glucose 4-epimerase
MTVGYAMNVLVTGGAGFIGSHTVDALLARGAQVRVLDDFSAGQQENLPRHSRLTVVRGDIQNGESLREALAGVSHVLHLAAQVSVNASVADPLASHSRNILGFLNVLETARQAEVERFVYASSAAVYGEPERLPLDENSPVKPLSPYGLEKSVNDQYGVLYSRLYGLSCLGLRYFNVYGPRQDPCSPYSGVISIFAQQAIEGRPLVVFGDGKQTRDFIFVGDVARANLSALESRETGVVNVATAKSVSLLDLIEALGACLGRKLTVEHQPSRVGDIRDSVSANARLKTWLKLDSFTPLETGLIQLLESLKNG